MCVSVQVQLRRLFDSVSGFSLSNTQNNTTVWALLCYVIMIDCFTV